MTRPIFDKVMTALIVVTGIVAMIRFYDFASPTPVVQGVYDDEEGVCRER